MACGENDFSLITPWGGGGVTGSFPEFYTPPEGSTPLGSPYVTKMKGDLWLVAPLSRLPGGSLSPVGGVCPLG